MSIERTRLEKIARLYYLEQLSQRQIADKFSISVASVSRSLGRARDLGIVHIDVRASEDSYHEIEFEIESRFGIDECIVTPAYEHVDSTYEAFARSVNDLLPRILPKRGLLGVSWGETLKALGERLNPSETLSADVVPVIGAMGTIETGIYPNSIARAFAERLGGRAYLVNAPAILDSAETAALVIRDSAFQQARTLWERLDVAILGAGGLDENTSVFRTGIFSGEELAALRAAGGVAATNFLFLASDGSLVDHPLAKRVVCLPEPLMRRVPSIVVVAGGAAKAAAVRASLASGIPRILVTDIECARRI